MRRALVPIAVVLLAGLAFTFLRGRGRRAGLAPFRAQSLAEPRQAPPLDAVDMAGQPVLVPDGAAGKLTLVHFWGTWCTPCRAELPGLLALADQLGASGNFQLYAVAVDDDMNSLREHFGSQIPAWVVLPSQRNAAVRYGARSIPDTFVVDKTGRIVERVQGAHDWSSGEAERHLRELMAR